MSLGGDEGRLADSVISFNIDLVRGGGRDELLLAAVDLAERCLRQFAKAIRPWLYVSQLVELILVIAAHIRVFVFDGFDRNTFFAISFALGRNFKGKAALVNLLPGSEVLVL